MATPSPSPEPATPELPPAPVTDSAVLPAGPTCAACGDTAIVNWRRRLTDQELAEHVAVEESRREQALLLADPQLPPPTFPPLPTGDDTTRTIYSCGPHAITLDAAALVHAASCTAPNEADLPDCDCTPEPHPPEPEPAEGRLPAHWLPGGD